MADTQTVASSYFNTHKGSRGVYAIISTSLHLTQLSTPSTIVLTFLVLVQGRLVLTQDGLQHRFRSHLKRSLGLSGGPSLAAPPGAAVRHLQLIKGPPLV